MRKMSRLTVVLFVCLSFLFAALPSIGANMDSGWRCWPDTAAAWQNDTLFLPGDAPLSALPTNPPTGGWAVLNMQQGIPVTLPGTVEEHLAQFFPPGGAPAPAGVGADAQLRGDAIYTGVSWWWRTFQAPALKPGQRLILHVRGARLRSEVYVNGRLCGYSLLTELPFDADVTSAIHAEGANQLAVRITNPGGFHDWNDLGSLIPWGKVSLPSSHGYGGLDRGITLEVRDPVAVDDLAVLNRPDLHTVQVNVGVQSAGPAYTGPVAVSVVRAGKTYWSGKIPVRVPAGGVGMGIAEVHIPAALPWTLDHPVLYQAQAQVPGRADSGKSTLFGFRWLAIDGLGTNARLRFNGKRIVLRSAISWGYWAPSGLWPTPAMAAKEAAAAKALGLNCLQAHRNLAKPEVLDVQDRAGLLRYEEPGAGAKAFDPSFINGQGSPPTKGSVDTSGNGGDTRDFTERYEEAKVLAMIRRDRSHPSVIIYCLQNEISPDLHNPRLFRVLREMQTADPSRIILLKSGDRIENQVLIRPWTTEILHDDGAGFSGWLDDHTAGHNNGGYVDSDYQDAAHYWYNSVPASWGADSYGLDTLPWFRSDNKKEVMVWGEMGGVGVPDASEKITQEYRKTGQPGYDRAYQEQMTSVYNKFLDDYGFRADYPTATSLFQAIGNSSYFFWQKALENGRMSDANDELVVSGWESTAIDNHTGLVDVHRNFRADPNIVHQATVPLLLVIRPRHYVQAAGDAAVVDVHLINEVNRHGPYRLSLSATGPSGQAIFHAAETVQVIGGEVYGQLLHAGWSFPVATPGVVILTASLTAPGSKTAFLSRSEKIQVVQLSGVPVSRSVAVREGGSDIKTALGAMGVTTVAEDAAQCIVYVPGASGWLHNGPVLDAVTGPDDPRLLQSHVYEPGLATLGTWVGLAKGRCRVDLLFAETFFNAAGGRDYDIAINGQTVLKNFDPFTAAGGKDKEVVREFVVDAPNGVISIAVTRVGRDNALVSAIRITDSAGKVIARCAYTDAFTDAHGQRWEPFFHEPLSAELAPLLDRVSRGLRLVIWPTNTDAASQVAEALAQSGIVSYTGSLGGGGAPWNGSWYFVRRHWLLDGLPAPCAMDWRYQVNAPASNGLLLSAPGLEAAIGYGKSNDPRVGMGAVVIPRGQGQIILFDLPGLESALTGDAGGIHPVVARRLLLNAVR